MEEGVIRVFCTVPGLGLQCLLCANEVHSSACCLFPSVLALFLWSYVLGLIEVVRHNHEVLSIVVVELIALL